MKRPDLRNAKKVRFVIRGRIFFNHKTGQLLTVGTVSDKNRKKPFRAR